jgi:hypothetical protein
MTDHGIVQDTGHDNYVPFTPAPKTSKVMMQPQRPNQLTPDDAIKRANSLTSRNLISAVPTAPRPQDQLYAEQKSTLPSNQQSQLDSILRSNTRPKNWYWLKGYIRGGQVRVSINGKSLGRFTSMVDQDITDRLSIGQNTLKFTPVSSSDGHSVTSRLELVYSQQPEGASPVLVYDTRHQYALNSSLNSPNSYSDDTLLSKDVYAYHSNKKLIPAELSFVAE